ncbi:MAG: thioredoxin family protein [Bacteroidales bacterium]|nr:thioredoxin family protein [Bacteroidales bacterium]
MNLKKICLMLTLFLASFLSLSAQITQPVSWSISSNDLGDNQYEIVLTAEIEPSWHIYDLGPYQGGPNPTALTFELSEEYELIGEPYIKSQVKRGYDEAFEMEIGTCDSPVIVAQKIKRVSEYETIIKVTVEWQACNHGSCIPPEEELLKITLAGEKNPAVVQSVDNQNVAKQDASMTTPKKKSSLWAVILEAILWGFVALATPCVFPMVPMTVSFFLKSGQNKSKRRGRFMAAFYGLSIVGLYTLPIALIILITYLVGGNAITADIFNWLSTHWLPNIIFFLVFMVFAASFFGAFEIVLPSKLVNSSDKNSDKGGLAGVFFMALTLVLVSFSCTGPIVGTVLIKSTSGEIWEPIITMLAFSIAFALPFTLFAFVPSLLKNLPKSGGWLNTVKVVLGFVELALGMKFLSVADQTYHWGLLNRELYLAIWIVIFSLLGLYLLGKLRFAHDTPSDHISVKRLFGAIISFAFVVYMIPGMWGAPLKALSGYLPPITTQEFVITNNPAPVVAQDNGEIVKPKYSEFLHLPHNLVGFFDYDEALAYSKKVGKPLFVDFTGHGCVNCREMEMRVWSDPRVLNLLREKFVIVALYADDKKVVDKEDWVTLDDGKVLKTLGKINSEFARRKFNVNAQPFYAILGPDEEPIATRGYNLDVEGFIEFLETK